MSKREKIIVLVTLLTALYGLYSFLWGASAPTRPPETGNSPAKLNRFTTDISKTIAGDATSKTDHYILERASAAWPEKPFLKSGMAPAATRPQKAGSRPRTDSPAIDLIYSGYLAIGDRKLAIINGVEYEAGDELAQPGYIIRNISPLNVVIEAAGEKNRIILALEENYQD